MDPTHYALSAGLGKASDAVLHMALVPHDAQLSVSIEHQAACHAGSRLFMA